MVQDQLDKQLARPHLQNNQSRVRRWWLTPIILVTYAAQIKRI
jgi:hypothetical protein